MTRSFRHGRACPGHPRLSGSNEARAWMPGTGPGMTHRRKACLKPSPVRAGGALGEQVPGSVDEGGKDDEGKRERKHETSVPLSRWNPDISGNKVGSIRKSRAASAP